jgi:hypothetical protein
VCAGNSFLGSWVFFFSLGFAWFLLSSVFPARPAIYLVLLSANVVAFHPSRHNRIPILILLPQDRTARMKQAVPSDLLRHLAVYDAKQMSPETRNFATGTAFVAAIKAE